MCTVCVAYILVRTILGLVANQFGIKVIRIIIINLLKFLLFLDATAYNWEQ